MQKKITEFLDFLFKKEQEAIHASNKKELFEEYNTLAKEIKSYMNDSSVGLGLPILSNPKPDFFYDENTPYPNIRHLYKISKYKNNKYGTIWACYISNPNPKNSSVRMLTKCFIITKQNEGFKIISEQGIDPNTNKWYFYGGDEDNSLRIHSLGTPIQIDRYLEPVNHDIGLEFYNKNK